MKDESRERFKEDLNKLCENYQQVLSERFPFSSCILRLLVQ